MISKNRVNRKTKKRYKRAINNIIKGLGRKVAVYKQPVNSQCPNCYYDKFTRSSTGKCLFSSLYDADQRQSEWEADGNTTTMYKYFISGRCPICNGKGRLEVQRKVWINCLVIWDPESRNFGNQTVYTPAGSEGATIVKLKTDPKHFDLFKNSLKFEVDDITCRISRPPILRGLGNKATLVITGFTTDKSQVDSIERINNYLD